MFSVASAWTPSGTVVLFIPFLHPRLQILDLALPFSEVVLEPLLLHKEFFTFLLVIIFVWAW